MKLNKKAQYALMAMVDLASQTFGHTVSLSNIAESQNLPLPYLEQLFIKLKKAGLVKSTRGTMGGYALSRSSKEIYVYDIIMATDDPIKATRCNSGGMCQKNGKRCITHDFLRSLERVVQNFLLQVTLFDVCEKRVNRFTLDCFTATNIPAQNLDTQTHRCVS